MLPVGKQVGQDVAAAAADDSKPGCLALLIDKSECRSYLVDTGSAYSILPFTSSAQPTGPALTATSGASKKAWGCHPVQLSTGGSNFCTTGWGGLGVCGKRLRGQAAGRQVQLTLQGARARQQGVEGPGGREGGDHQQGPPEASLGQPGPQGHCTAEAWEAEDGLCSFCGSKARGDCVADSGLQSPGEMLLISQYVCKKMREIY